MAEIGKDIRKAVELLERGEVIGMPTETVYGLAGNALDEQAVEKIFSVKNRPKFNPLIMHVDTVEKVMKHVLEIPETATVLMEEFWPGPLTLLLPKAPSVSDVITAGHPTVAVRIPSHSIARSLLAQVDFPVAAPSANPFGYISPTTSAHVEKQIGWKIPYILEGGNCMEGVESTIVGFERGTPIIYRLGSLSVEEISSIVPHVKLQVKPANHPIAPGMLAYHYSPKTPLILTEDVNGTVQRFVGKRIGLITYSDFGVHGENGFCERLTYSEDLKEAARNLYAAMQNLDSRELDIIIAERFPDRDSGRTLNDRLEKAANKYK